MQSFLIAGGNSEDQTQKIISILSSSFQLQILSSSLNHPSSNPDIYISQSYGIEESRKIIRFLALKPYHQSFKIVIIPQADQLTTEAQNTLLKTLEEPPSHSLLFLLTGSTYTLLPTVVSRLEVHELKSNFDTDPEIFSNLHSLLNLPPGEAVKLSETLTPDRESAIKFCSTGIISLEPFLSGKNIPTSSITFTPSQASKLIRIMSQTLIYLNANTTLRLTIDNLLIQLRKAYKSS